MLKFWKKTGRKETCLIPGSSSTSTSSTPPTCNGGSFFGGSLTSQIKEMEDLIREDSQEVTSSRLSKTLAEVLNDSEAFTYFIQYLETIGQGAMIKFILDVESFNSALSDIHPNVAKQSGFCTLQCNDVLVSDKIKGGESPNEETTHLTNSENMRGCQEGCDGNAISADVNLCCNSENGETDREENLMLSRLMGSGSECESLVDAVKIFKKYFSKKAPLKISLNEDIRKRLLNNLNSNIGKETFSEVKEYILGIIENEHFNDYLRSESHCKYQIDVLTSKKICISDILFNETALFYFMEFLEQEGSTNFLEFWMSAQNFQQQYQDQGETNNVEQAQNDAMVLYEKYFSLQATNPLHLGDDVRMRVEESICREEGPLPNCFEHPRKLIVKLLETNYFQPFLQSQLYFKYLSELISTIQTSPVLGHRSRGSGADSDGGSDVSISVTNTLLASEDSNPGKKLYRHLNSSSLTIDAQQLYDPDSLWQRGSKRPGLNFGRVNALGRFETDLEPEPDKKEESRITKAVKKLVNLNEDKSKEEMAWQVAAMIVRDVTNITMPTSTES